MNHIIIHHKKASQEGILVMVMLKKCTKTCEITEVICTELWYDQRAEKISAAHIMCTLRHEIVRVKMCSIYIHTHTERKSNMLE